MFIVHVSHFTGLEMDISSVLKSAFIFVTACYYISICRPVIIVSDISVVLNCLFGDL